ncbi:MAG: hypothetical protein EAZ97_01460, partial [Bacteroidetes bacterium]
YPGGQSGNAGSHYYVNMIDSWAEGKYYDLLFLHSVDEKNPNIWFKQNFSAK